MELALQLKKHFLLENNNKGIAVVESEARRDFLIANFAQSMKINNYDIIALDESRAKNIYRYKEKIATELKDKTFIVVKGDEFFCSVLAQDVIRFYEKRAKLLKVLIMVCAPVNTESEVFKVALNYADNNLIFKEDDVESTGARGRILKLHPESSIGFYELLEEDGTEYTFEIKKSMTTGVLKLRKDKARWKDDAALTGKDFVNMYFDYTDEKPSEKDLEVFVSSIRKMEIPPRMVLM